MNFYLFSAFIFFALSTRPKSPGDLVIRFTLQYLLLVWLVIPFFLATNIDNVTKNVMFDYLAVEKSYEIELFGFFISTAIYLFFNKFITKTNRIKPVSHDAGRYTGKVNEFFLISSSILILISVAYSFVSPSSYEEINQISSTAGVGGKFGLPIIEPLLLAYIIGFLIFDSFSKKRYWVLAMVCLCLYSITKVIEGGRFALIYPLIPSFIVLILERGRLFATRRLLLIALVFSPFLAYAIIELAAIRVGSSFDFDQDLSESFNLLIIHLYLKFSSVINSTALAELVQRPSFMQGITALAGVPLSVLPRFIWPGKPISGSIDGLETGLPYRIAADVLGYPDYGNVGLSPFITSNWMLGGIGFILTSVVFAVNLLLISRLLTKAARGQVLFAGIGLYLLGLPHFSAVWVDFSAGLSILFRSIIFSWFGILIYGRYFSIWFRYNLRI